MENLIEIAKQIIEANPGAVLSGSIAINLQGIKTRKPPNDIDILMPIDIPFKKIPGMNYTPHAMDEDYESYYERDSYKIGDIKIDVFFPAHNKVYPLFTEKMNGLELVRFDEVIKFKVKFALSECTSREKHQMDIVYMMNENN